jgi:cytochrome c oxidase assembly factor CtaG
LYLFLATLPCDILSGFLVFSERVAYPVYLSTQRLFGFSVLQDQQCAGALMWTIVTIVYLVPAAILTTRLLTVRSSVQPQAVQSKLQQIVTTRRDPQSVEVV